MSFDRFRLGLVLLVGIPTLALSGCIRPAAEPLPLTELAGAVPVREEVREFTWPDAVWIRTGSEAPPPPLLLPGALPRVVPSPLPGGGGEPNIGVTQEGWVFVTVFDRTMRSKDKGLTWEEVWDFTTPNYPVTDDHFSTSDPMLWVDPTTNRVYTSHMHPGPACQYLAWSDDGGATWTERPLACTLPYPGGFDHQKLMTARNGPKSLGNLLPLPSSPSLYPNVVYLCYNGIGRAGVGGVGLWGTWCDVSFDGGLTWPRTAKIAEPSECGALNGHPASFEDGTVVVPLGSFGGCERTFEVVLTEDDGATWEKRDCGGKIINTELDPDITITKDQTAYVLFRGKDQLVHLLRTKDRFVTCEVFDVSPKDHTFDVFTAITSGDNGRIAFAFLGTVDPQDPDHKTTPSFATPGTNWHLFVGISVDADSPSPTFVVTQVTPREDPVQVGCVWLLGGSGGPYRCRNLLDFIDMTHDSDGRFYVSFTDGCTPRNGCTGQPFQADFQTRDREVQVAVQVSGLSLFADKGLLEPLNLTWPSPLPRI